MSAAAYTNLLPSDALEPLFFLGRTTYAPQVARANELLWGEMCVRQLPFRGLNPDIPTIFDNGTFGDFSQGKPFNEDAWRRCWEEWDRRGLRPAALVAPDEVAAGLRSLELSYKWLKELKEWGAPVLLAVQNGMPARVIEAALRDFDGLFVGGDTHWKFTWGRFCVRLAHRQKKPCHIGRLGTVPRILWGRLVGADSFDSTTPLRPGQPLKGSARAKPGLGRNWLDAERALSTDLSPELRNSRANLRQLSRRLAGRPAAGGPTQLRLLLNAVPTEEMNEHAKAE